MSRHILIEFLVLALGLAVCPGWSQTALFQKARHGEEGDIWFQSFHEVAWPKIAQSKLSWLNVPQPTAEQVERLKKLLPEGDPSNDLTGFGNTAQIPFEAALEPELARGFYYLISPSGIRPLKPAHLVGSANYTFDDSRTRIEKQDFNGHIVSKTSQGKLDDGGFVLFTTRPTKMAPAVAPRSLLLRLPADDRPEDIAKAFLFQFDGARFLFVKWKGYPQIQKTLCGYDYSLYRVAKDVILEQANAYACDL